MDRRGFLKQAGALAVGSAFPLPAEPIDAALHFAGVPIKFDDCTISGPEFILVSPEFMEAMDKVWRECTRDLRWA